ncbi:MAG: NAD(P)-dependent oxidoreductase [Puia sp.]
MPIGNTPGVLSNATADIALLLMLACSRKAMYMHNSIQQGDWGFFEPTANLGIDIRGKTLGIFGLGKIGYELARRASAAFDMKIIYHNRGRHPEAERELGARRVSFDDLLENSDVLSVHTALTPETRGRFNRDVFVRMKRTSIFINSARGAIHNEEDLTEALRDGIIWGAGLDVTNPEPMRRTILCCLCLTFAYFRILVLLRKKQGQPCPCLPQKNIVAGLKGERLPFIVNPDVYA